MIESEQIGAGHVAGMEWAEQASRDGLRVLHDAALTADDEALYAALIVYGDFTMPEGDGDTVRMYRNGLPMSDDFIDGFVLGALENYDSASSMN